MENPRETPRESPRESPRCANCFYGRPGETYIICQRYPPTITSVDIKTVKKIKSPTVTSYFPLLGLNSWCGEHRPAQERAVIDTPMPVSGTALSSSNRRRRK